MPVGKGPLAIHRAPQLCLCCSCVVPQQSEAQSPLPANWVAPDQACLACLQLEVQSECKISSDKLGIFAFREEAVAARKADSHTDSPRQPRPLYSCQCPPEEWPGRYTPSRIRSLITSSLGAPQPSVSPYPCCRAHSLPATELLVWLLWMCVLQSEQSGEAVLVHDLGCHAMQWA